MTLSLWIDPDDPNQVTLDGALIRQIADKSGDGNDVRGAGDATFIASFDNASPNTVYRSRDPYQADLEFYGGAALSAGPSPNKFASGALSIPATSSPWPRVQIPQLDHMTIGTNDFTIEMWVWFNNVNTGSFQGLWDSRADSVSNENSPALYCSSADGTLRYYVQGGRITGSVPTANQWEHIVLARSGTTTRMYLNGVHQGAWVSDSTNYLARRVILGNLSNFGGGLDGYIDSIRFYNGLALYTGTSPEFTPPTVPFVDAPEADIVLYGNRSPGREMIDTTLGGFLAAENRSPNLVNMDGPDLSVSIAVQDFPTSSPIDLDGSTLFGMYATASPEDDAGWKLEDLTGGDIFRARIGSSDPIDLVPVDEDVVFLASFDGDDAATAYVSQDSGRRTATFTGNAQLDTADSKFGKSSLRLDGTGDWITFPDSPDFDLGSEDFTFEGWYKFNSHSGDADLWSRWEASGQRSFLFWSGTAGFDLYITTNGSTTIQVGTDVQFPWTPSPTIGQWHHIAIVRDGSTMRVFVDGVQIGSSTTIGSSTIFNSTEPLKIGSHASVNDFDGWMDDLRITKGVALHNPGSPPTFTVPTRSYARTLGDNDKGVLSLIYDSSSSVIQTYVNGQESGAIPYTGTPGFAQNLTLGGSVVTGDYFQSGRILEAVYYDGRLLPDDIERIEGYMAHKWNFPDALPATHPYRYEGPAKAEAPYPETVFVANFNSVRTDAVASPPGYTSETGQQFSFIGNANLDTNRAPFAGSSILLDGTGDYIETADSDDWNFDGDFTVESWVWFDGFGSNSSTFMSNWNTNGGSTQRGWTFSLQTDVSPYRLRFFSSTDSAGTGQVDMFADWQPSTNRWYHVAASREGSTVRLFVDGQQIGTDLEYGSPVAIFNAATTLAFGVVKANAGFFYHQGSIGPCRIVKGRAIYKRDFILPSRPFRIPTASTLIANFNGLDGVASPPGYTSEDASARTMSFIGNAQLDSAMKKTGVSSLLLDGTGDRVEIAHSADFELGSGDFTVETMVRWSADPGTSVEPFVGQWSQNESPADQREWLFYFQNNTVTLGWSTDGAGTGFGQLNIAFNPVADRWYHLVVERYDGVAYFWIDGVHSGSGAVTATFHSGSAPLVIGGNDEGTQDFTGWIDHVRIIKGYALRSTINPPEVPYSTVGEDATTLMLNFDGVSPATSYTTDDAYAIPLTFYNGAQISNVERYVGSSSLAVVAEADAVEIPQQSPQQFALGTGDFTIEFMCKFSAAPGASYNAIIDQRVSGTTQVRPYIGTNLSSNWTYYVNGADRITGSTPTTGHWYHVVVERVNGSTRMYVDGIEQGTGYNDSNNYLDGEWTIGSRWDQGSSNNSFEGYIDAFRVTYNRARYKGDFTVPTKPIGEPE